jgi:hypothetical protein
MRVSVISKDDCKCVAQLINMLQAGDFKVSGKDMCAGADSLRWLQQFAVDLAKVYQEEQKPAVSAPEVEPQGLRIKSYNPGKLGKK